MTKKQSTLLYILAAVAVVALVGMIVTLSLTGKTVVVFTPPPFDTTAKEGTPDIPDGLEWDAFDNKDMAYSFSVCGREVATSGKEAILYFTNHTENDSWLKIRIYEYDVANKKLGELLGESGIVKPGQYIKSVLLEKVPTNGAPAVIKVMGYEPVTYKSTGAVTVNTKFSATP